MPWNDKFECMPVEELKKFQLEKLKETVDWVSKRVPFYKNKFKEMGLKAGDLKSLEDVAKLPFTVKNDLRDNYPFGLCAVPMEEVVRLCGVNGPHSHRITVEAQRAVFDLIEGWYNLHQLHLSLGYDTPARHERRYAAQIAEGEEQRIRAKYHCDPPEVRLESALARMSAVSSVTLSAEPGLPLRVRGFCTTRA